MIGPREREGGMRGSLAVSGADEPTAGESYAGVSRYTTLEYEAVLANASIGIAFTRDRKFFLCNPRFSELFGWEPEALIGQSGEVIYPSRESYEALGRMAIPVLSAGQQLDIEWEMRRRDGSTFMCRIIAKAIDPENNQRGTVWLGEDVTARKRADDEIERLIREQQAIFDSASAGIVFLRDRTIVRCNRRFEELFGYGSGELIGRSTQQLYAHEPDFRTVSGVYDAVWAGKTGVSEARMRRKDGSTFLCSHAGRAVNPGEPASGSVWLYDDITAERAAEERLRATLAEQQVILDNATVGIAFVRHRKIQRGNARFHEMFGYTPGELDHQGTGVLFESSQEYERAGREAYAPLQAGASYQGEWIQKRKNGLPLWCKIIGKAVDPARVQDGSIWIYEDVSAERTAKEALESAVAQRTSELKAANDRLESEIAERKAAEERARHLADHDALTGLPNRRLLEDRLTQALALSNRNRRHTAVMFIDLDRFKAVNDSLGHAAGDALLKEVAQRLAALMREGDTICRIGGDEFVLVLPDVGRPADARRVAQKVIEDLSRPVALGDRDAEVTPSIGICISPEDGSDAETLIRNADAAMYQAKQAGRANCQFFADGMNAAALKRIEREGELRTALQADELKVVFQPILDLASGRLAGHEALMRWQHPRHGVISTSEFIHIAEETGLILTLGAWVLEQACRRAAALGEGRDRPIAVNVSPRQLADPGLAVTVARVLAQTGQPASLLELEVSETAIAQHADAALASMRALKDMGVAFVIDDFGAAASSLTWLSRGKVGKLKIARSLVQDAPANPEHSAMIRGIVALAHAMEIRVVAKGVETREQEAFARQCGCDEIQGYLVGHPFEIGAAGARP